IELHVAQATEVLDVDAPEHAASVARSDAPREAGPGGRRAGTCRAAEAEVAGGCRGPQGMRWSAPLASTYRPPLSKRTLSRSDLSRSGATSRAFSSGDGFLASASRTSASKSRPLGRW